MYGAILGDIVGSPYEFDCNNYKAKDFPLFSRRSDFTDDIGALASMAVALTLLVLNFTGVIHLINDLIGLIPAAIVYVVVSLFTYKEDKAVA